MWPGIRAIDMFDRGRRRRDGPNTRRQRTNCASSPDHAGVVLCDRWRRGCRCPRCNSTPRKGSVAGSRLRAPRRWVTGRNAQLTARNSRSDNQIFPVRCFPSVKGSCSPEFRGPQLDRTLPAAVTSPIAAGRSHRLSGKPPPPMQGMNDHWQGGERTTSRKDTPNGDSRRDIGWLRSEVDPCIASRPRATEPPDDRRRDSIAF